MNEKDYDSDYGKVIYDIGTLFTTMQVNISSLKAENKRLNDIFERWEHMIDPETNPGGCANCFHQEWKGE